MRQSLGEVLLEALLPEAARREAEDLPLRERMAANDLAGVGKLFRGVFAAIPHQWYMNGPLAAYEGHYASVIHSCFLMQGFEPVGEDSGSRGRADMALKFNGRVYLFEFKVVERGREGTALEQLRQKGYADKYRSLGPSGPPDRGGVQPGGAEHRRLLGRGGLTGGISGRPFPQPRPGSEYNGSAPPPPETGHAPSPAMTAIFVRGAAPSARVTFCGMPMPYSRVCPAPRPGSPFDPERPGA